MSRAALAYAFHIPIQTMREVTLLEAHAMTKVLEAVIDAQEKASRRG